MIQSKYFLIVFSFCLLALASCDKSNIDDLITEEEENSVVVVNCDGFSVQLYESDGIISPEVIEGTGPYTYFWSTEETSENIIVDQTGVYSVTVTDNNDCETVGEISVEIESNPCDNTLSFNSEASNLSMFSAESEAYVWKGTCPDGSAENYDHSYLIVDVNWYANLEPHIYHISDGLPGISFGSNGAPEVGDVLSPYFIGEDLFRIDFSTEAYIIDGMQITITESSNEVGGQIGGVISGQIAEHNDPSIKSDVSGTFCVTIVSVCE